jgi:hypothetical protein
MRLVWFLCWCSFFFVFGGIVAVGYENAIEFWAWLSEGWRLVVVAVSLLACATGLWKLEALQYDEQLIAVSIAAPSIGACAVLLSVKHWQNANAKVPFLVGLLLCSLGLMTGGTAMARQQIARSDVHYDIVTKSGAFVDVRILRSSSSGFVFSKGDHILFVPSGEVRLITATNDAPGRNYPPAP